ncbi:chemotaxis protein CheD [Priestia megaterium]|nr:chemotaxis protein CheD [Priestia megaterium]
MNNVEQIVRVGIADLNIVKQPNLIRTAGLGSCVGVIIYDSIHSIAGLAHIMLPDSSVAKSPFNRAKYADTAIEDLLETLGGFGIYKRSLKAKIAGGAQMFQFHSTNDFMRIGARNVEAVEKELDKYGIELVAKDVGGHSGRTIEFNPQTSMLTIRTVNKGIKEI